MKTWTPLIAIIHTHTPSTLVDMFVKVLCFSLLAGLPALAQNHNPIFDGWYADPDICKFGDTYWVYATTSAGGTGPAHFDAHSSKDLINWTKHPAVFSATNSSWATRAFWAPSCSTREGRYYLHWAANSPPGDGNGEPYGIGAAVADSPAGPFVDTLNEPLIGSFLKQADPIDQQVFHDPKTNQDYLLWGNTIAVLAEFDVVGSQLNTTNATVITPEGEYFEGPYMLYHDGWYYFSWSLGFWNTADYRVAYASSRNLFGPYVSQGVILQKDGVVGNGPGHHAIFQGPDGEFKVIYHRRSLSDGAEGHRVVAIDNINLHDGIIDPVTMT